MCGRYTLRRSVKDIVQRFFVTEVATDSFGDVGSEIARYNIAPSQPIAVITENSPRVLEMMRWGLVPSWASDPSIGNRLLNARAETLAEKPSFRSALTRRRCIIPADGFYEWKTVGKKKQPYRIHRNDDALFAFAGLWEEWTSPDGSPLRTCTIVTVEANELMTDIHGRMPAILRAEDEARWLDRSEKSVPNLLSLLVPYPDDDIEAYTVSTLVNSAANEDPACVTPLEPNGELVLPI